MNTKSQGTPRRLRTAFVPLTLALGAVAPAYAWQASDAQLLVGHGFKLGSANRAILTLEHVRGGDMGDVFVFLDTTFRDDIGEEYYGEAYAQLSLTGSTGRAWRLGPIKDVSLSLGVNAGSEPEAHPFRAWLAGVSLDFEVPGFRFVQFDLHAYKDEAAPRTGWQLTPAWDSTFHLDAQEFRFRGFADWISGRASTGGKPQLLTQPQLLWNLGKALGVGDQLWLGVEYQYWRNKYGLPGVKESLPQVMLMLGF
jgi:nucleoside-specific outer membrane channel protein Tsx